MCGISGIWHLDGEKLDKEKMTVFNDTLSHRGPDFGSIFIDQKSNLGLGHRRLSIIDLSSKGNQPMTYSDSRFTIIFNGEVYNFIELRLELEKIGYKFDSQSDTEVILASYKEWGAECLDKFNGMWTMAIWDSQEKRLFLSRDRFGVKPLYYVFIPGKILAFASETISFTNLEGYKKEIDKKILDISMKDPFAVEGQGYTIYKNIFQILPGHYSLIKKEDREIKQVRWWNTLKHLDQNLPQKYEDRVEMFKNIFADACKIRLRSDVPIGTALSGGVDSSAVYCMINKVVRDGYKTRVPEDWQRAFVGVFKDTEYDESEYAREVIRFTGGKAVYIEQDGENIIEEMVKSTKLFDSIYISPISVISNIYRSMRENGVKVSLDGHGVDEMLFGYRSLLGDAQKYLAGEISNSSYENIFGKSEECGVTFPDGEPRPNRDIKDSVKALLPTGVKSILKKIIKSKDTFDLPPIGESSPEEEALTGLDKIVYNTFHRRTLPTILRNFDRASMQHGIEVRMPFMDWRLVSLVFSLSIEDKIHKGFTKRILRDSMAGEMPESIRMRRLKIGLNAPLKEWFSGPLKEYVEGIFNDPLFKEIAGKEYSKLSKMKTLNSKEGWNFRDCVTIWPYINAFILLK